MKQQGQDKCTQCELRLLQTCTNCNGVSKFKPMDTSKEDPFHRILKEGKRK